MKLQDVILKAMTKKLTWMEAAAAKEARAALAQPDLLRAIRRFPLFHRPHYDSCFFQIEGEEDSIKPNRTTNVLIKPDNYKS